MAFDINVNKSAINIVLLLNIVKVIDLNYVFCKCFFGTMGLFRIKFAGGQLEKYVASFVQHFVFVSGKSALHSIGSAYLPFHLY